MTTTNSPSSSLADAGIKFIDIVGKVANIALRADKTIEQVDSIIAPVAGFIPYYSQVMTVLRDADPILTKIVQYAPVAEEVIDDGRPAIDWVQENAPQIIPHIEAIIAAAKAKGPAGAIGAITSELIASFAQNLLVGRPMTRDEEEAWFKRAQGQN